MERATEKQIKYAASLGIENPENFSKTALKELISAKLGGNSQQPKKSYQNAPNTQKQGVSTAHHDIIINRTEKPHSYEFGKAGDRHKIYYNDVSELLEHIKALKQAELIAEEFKENDIETQKF